MGKWIKEKQNKQVLLIACIHFFLSFFTDRLIFTYSLWDFTKMEAAFKTLLAWGSKAAFFVFLVVFWRGVFWFIKKADRTFVKYVSIYFFIMCILLLLIWPGIWRMDEFGILFEARNTFPNFWQHYLTSMFYIMALMLFPTPAGVILTQNLVISLIVGWILYKFQKVILKERKTSFIYAGYIPFLFFPVLDSNLYPMRMSLYAYLELLLLAKLIFISIERKISRQETIALAILSAIVINWRSEAIYYLVALPICFLVLCWKFTDKKVKTRFIILLSIFSLLLMMPQKAGEKMGEKLYDANANNYQLTSMLLPVVPLIESIYMDGALSSYYPESEEVALLKLKDKKTPDIYRHTCYLYLIDKVIDVQKAAQAAREGRTGISLYWSEEEFVRDYTDEQFAVFQKIYWQLVFEKPEVFLKERLQTFVQSKDLLENTTELFTKEEIPNYEKFRQLFLAKPISDSLRTKVISILEFRDLNQYTKKLCGYSVVYSAIPAMVLECFILLSLLWKRKWGFSLLLASHMAKIPLIFLTAPSRLFMYYYPVYLIGYVLTTFLVIYYVVTKKDTRKNLRKAQEG